MELYLISLVNVVEGVARSNKCGEI